MWARLREMLACARTGSARYGRLGFISWYVAHGNGTQNLSQRLRTDRSRYHLSRSQRLRDARRYEAAIREARRALALTPSHPWALAVLGQCLLRQQSPDLTAARRVTEQAWALDPTNGYFVRLLLDVIDAQGDIIARAELLDWAWWKGAPVERWLPHGALRRSREDVACPAASLASGMTADQPLSQRQAVGALAPA